MKQIDNILEKTCNGDIDSFNKIFLEIKPKLRSFIFRMLTDKSECDDIVHDVFIKASGKSSCCRKL